MFVKNFISKYFYFFSILSYLIGFSYYCAAIIKFGNVTFFDYILTQYHASYLEFVLLSEV